MADEEKNKAIEDLLAQKKAIEEKLGVLSHDPNHPVLKPVSDFSEGEEVTVTIQGQSAAGKVLDVVGSEEGGFTYKVAASIIVNVKADSIKKA